MFALLRRLLMTTTLLALLASNVLTLTSSAFNAALSGVLATSLGVRTVTEVLNQRLRNSQAQLVRSRAVQGQQKMAARRFGRSLVARSQRVAARSIAAIPAESLPYIGVAAILAGTAYELYAMCETLKDLDSLYASLEIEESAPDSLMATACDPQGALQRAVSGQTP